MSKKLVIFSDIDGTLLCRDTYNPGPAKGILRECLYLGIDIVLVSSKNRHEIMGVRRELGITASFISENGGGLFVPRFFISHYAGATIIGSYWRISWDGDISWLRSALYRAAKETGVSVRLFSEMTPPEISKLTGLSQNHADLARYREYDEPFIIIDETPEKVKSIKAEIEARGYRYTHGGKFHHITGTFNKGDRAMLVKSLYMKNWPDIKFGAIGDAQNDLPLLKIADYPYLVRTPGGAFEKQATFDGIKVTDGVGPDGFVEAVRNLIDIHFIKGQEISDRGSHVN